MSNLNTRHADPWQTVLNTLNANANDTPESQGYFVMPDDPRGPLLFSGIITTTRKARVTHPEVARNDVTSTDDEEEEEEEVPVNSGRAWSAKDKMRMVRMRAGKVTFKVIAKKLGRNPGACQGVFYKIRDQPEYKAILDAGGAYESDDDEKQKKEKKKEDKKK